LLKAFRRFVEFIDDIPRSGRTQFAALRCQPAVSLRSAVHIFPTIVAANEIEGILSRNGLPRSFRRSTVGSWGD
jgi:hypothetical protein